MRLNSNILAMNSVRNLMSTGLRQATALERLSSGKKINRASDNAAGYAISGKMALQAMGLKMASKNSLDGVSLIQTAEGALNEVHSMLQRMRELSVQAANDSNILEDRQFIQNEINQLTSEINRIGKTSEYNKMNMFLSTNEDGTFKPDMNVSIQAGANSVQMVDIEFMEMSSYALGISAPYTGETASPVITEVGGNIIKTSKLYGNLNPKAGEGLPIPPATYPNDLNSIYNKTQIDSNDPAKGFTYTMKDEYKKDDRDKGTKSILGRTTGTVILDKENGKSGSERKIQFDIVKTENPNRWDVYGFYVDNSGAMVPMQGTQVKTDITDTTGLGKIHTIEFDSNGNPTSATSNLDLSMLVEGNTINNIKIDFSGITQKENPEIKNAPNNIKFFNTKELSDRVVIDRNFADNKAKKDDRENLLYKKEYALDITTQESANIAIKIFDNAITKVSELRAILGAAQNRFESNIKNLDNAEENVTQSMSRIQDADMAEEMTEFTKFNILQQSGTSMLAQANQIPQMVLKLLES